MIKRKYRGNLWREHWWRQFPYHFGQRDHNRDKVSNNRLKRMFHSLLMNKKKSYKFTSLATPN